jgi:hypothetical protein
MQYVSLGIKRQLQKYYRKIFSEIEISTDVEIALNVDGLPLFKCSSTVLWPVLCAIINVKPAEVFPVTLACGSNKPSNLDFLLEVITDLKDLLKNGLEITRRHVVGVKLCNTVCDAPARSMIKAAKLYSGYAGCDKCCQNGTWPGLFVCLFVAF